MRLALVQMANLGSMAANLESSLHYIRKASQNGADLVLFPEVHLTEFFPQYPAQEVSSYLVSLDSELMNRFRDCCKESGVMAAPNIYLSEGGKAYDASVLIDRNGEIIGVQKMVHVAQAKQFYEQDYYTPADDGFKVFDTAYGKIGIVVCFDRHYPESIRTEALMGADLILIPTVNTKAEPSEMFAWELRVQAFHSSVVIAMCNRAGREGEMDFSGESIVVDADGNVLAKADEKEQILYVDIAMEEAKRVREQRPYTNLRRTEFYL